MKRTISTALGIFAAITLCSQSVNAAARTWGNSGTDYNTSANWNAGAGPAPGAGDVGLFNAAEATQPNVSVSLSNAGVYFAGTTISGYDLTSSSSAIVLTLTGVGSTGNGGTSNSSAAALRSEATSGTNTVDAPLNLGAAAAATQVFFQAAGGTLVVNGPVSSTNAVTLSFKGTGTIQLNGANTFTSGSNINDAGTTLVVGNDSALGTGAFTMSSSGTIQAGGGARTLANAIVLAGNTTISGGNAFTFNGTTTSSGSNSRTLAVSNTGGAIFNGNVFLSDSDSTLRSLQINGTSNVQINGVVANNNVGNTLASALKFGGTGILTLNNTNTYSGSTSMSGISGGTLVANKDGALGSGSVFLTAAGESLTLQNGILNNYIADVANLSLLSTDTINLNFNGTDTIGALIIDGVGQAPGVYGSAASGAPNQLAEFTGNGELNVTATAVPEPSTWAMIFMGATSLVGMQLRRKRS